MIRDARETQVNGPALRAVLKEMMHDPAKIAAMGDAAGQLGHVRAAAQMACELFKLIKSSEECRSSKSLEQSHSLAR
jgi:hypothetical protein